MKQIRLLFVLLSATTLVACTHSSPHFIDTESPEAGITVATTPDDNQVIYIKGEGSTSRYCAETNVDYSETSSSGLSASFGLAGSQDSVGDTSGTNAVNFGGRDPAVLIARELMYRACEFNANMNSDARMAVTIYAGTLDAIVKIAIAQQGIGTAPTTVLAATTTAGAGTANVAGANSTAGNTAGTTTGNSTAPIPATPSGSASNFDWSKAFDYVDTIDPNHP